MSALSDCVRNLKQLLKEKQQKFDETVRRNEQLRTTLVEKISGKKIHDIE